MAQSMEYEDIVKLTHTMETILALFRSGGLKVEKDTVDVLFKSVDVLGDLIEEIKEGKEKRTKVAPLVAKFGEITSAVPKGEREAVRKERSYLKREDTDLLKMKEKQSEVLTVRVPLAQLDSLMDLTGELVINRIRLTQIAQTIESSPLEETVSQMSRLTSQLQDQMMQVRLVPLEYIFAPYPRMLRDMAAGQKKEVDLVIEGSHIGLDRSIQDEINGSLLHLLKNAITHGIEEPGERKRLKKSRRGMIRLAARRARNFVVIDLSDDGRGIDIEEIKDIVSKKGIVTKEELSALTPEEVVLLVTHPGFSRIKNVTEAAGRGVGLNASRVKVESFGGTLNIDSSPNEGTTISIKLPLTMAIVQAMLVGIADETYCIPLSYIAETIKILPKEIKTMEHNEMISYRDTVLPLIRLREKFGFPASILQPPDSDISNRIPAITVVVVGVGPRKAGLVVDSLLGQQEVVIKPLAGILKEIKGASGATILGTGRAALIVDVGSLL
jgi:two-component system chemotaxis sensor kinase CheA